VEPDDLILVSVDDHIAEPADMFDAHVPSRYLEQAPKVLTDENGDQQWWYGNIKGRNLGLNAVAGKPPEMYNTNPNRYEEMRPGCFDVHERVRDMSAGGQLAGLNFPNFTGFSGQVLNQGPDRDLNLIMIKAYNDWHVDEWCAAYPDRFIPCGILPLFEVEEAAKELRRLAAKGVHAVTFSENPEALGMPSIHSGHWDPLFAAASDEETILCCHLGSSSRSPMTTADAPASVPMNLSPAATVYTFGDLVWADFWWRYPELKFSLTEGDVGWIPYFIQKAENTYKRHSGWTKHRFPEDTGPGDLFRERVLCCFINDPVAVELLHHLNVDNVCWESDFPHSDSIWPDAPEELSVLFEKTDDATVSKITHENAMRHFRFDPYATRSKDRCTVAALRSEATDVDTVTHVGRLADERDAEYFQKIASRSIKKPVASQGEACN
jgi:predicted TIM-barrel fold metal-dependent hydrolase